MLQKVTEPSKIVTDAHLLTQLDKPDDWEFFEDYNLKHISTKIYRNLKTGERLAVCQGLPKVRHDGVKICGNSPNETTIGWEKSPSGYRGKPNVFSVATVGKKVYLKRLDNQKRVNWKPQISLDNIEKPCNPNPSLLDDSTNPNYHDNVLEWDYGFCIRRLRQIEGFISDYKIIFSNPHGEVRVKLNQSGNLKLNLSGAIDTEGNSLGRVEGDEEIVSAEEFDKAVYPVTIGASTTVFSTASDGIARMLSAATWDAAHDAPNSDDTRTNIAGEWLSYSRRVAADDWHIYRSFFYFVHGLAVGATVTGVTTAFKGTGLAILQADAGHPDICVVEGVQDDPLNVNDYGDHLLKTTLLHATAFDADTWNVNAYNVITFDATGIAWVQAAIDGSIDIKLCVRAEGDRGDTPPTGTNSILCYFNEQGVGDQPRLVITYIPAVGGGARLMPMGGGSSARSIGSGGANLLLIGF